MLFLHYAFWAQYTHGLTMAVEVAIKKVLDWLGIDHLKDFRLCYGEGLLGDSSHG